MSQSTAPRLAFQIRSLHRHWDRDPEFGLGEILSAKQLQPLLTEEGADWKRCLYTPVLTFWAFLWQVLSPDRSCQSAVARLQAWLSSRGRPPCPSDTSPYCKARQRLPEAVPLRLARQLGRDLHRQAAPRWRWCGRSVKLVDGTTVSMPDTAANQAAYPQNPAQAPGLGFPLARMVVLFCLATGAVLDAAIGRYQGKGTSEVALFRSLWDGLDEGDVILGDRFFGSYFALAMLQQRGIDGVFRLHQRRITDYRRGRRLGRTDHVVTWQRPQRPDWMDRATYEQIPEALEVREMRVQVAQKGFRTRSLEIVTTLLDAQVYTKQDIATLYRMRWHAELDLRSIKVVLGVDVLRCKTPEMVRKELWMSLVGYNVIRALMGDAARAHGKEPRKLSFKGALQILTEYAEQLRSAKGEGRRRLRADVLRAIAGLGVGDRPDRIEPRARKRRPKPYPLLMKPRKQAKAALLKAG